MSVIFLLIPLSVLIAVTFLGAFIWAVRSGQYEDTYTPSVRLLTGETDLRRKESLAAAKAHRSDAELKTKLTSGAEQTLESLAREKTVASARAHNQGISND
jgi:cbb3-type cytochrome oxidase maturation protein